MTNISNFSPPFFSSPLLPSHFKLEGKEQPLVRKSSQPQKKPVPVAAPVAPASPAGAAAVSPSPVTSPEAGTDSEAGKGNLYSLSL